MMSFPAESVTDPGERSGAKKAGLRPGAGSTRRTGLTRTPAALRRLERIDAHRWQRRSHASIWSMKCQPSPKPRIVSMLLVLTTSLFAFSACSEKVQGRSTFDSKKDGGRIAFASSKDGDIHIYVMNADGSGVRQVTDEPGVDFFPAWSPDGTTIAFQRRRRETDGLGLTGPVGIYVINADGSGLRRLTIDGTHPAWSPDGSRIAFASERNGQSDIYVMNADGSQVQQLTNDAAGDFVPAWSPDGGKIAFAKGRNEQSDVYVMNSDGSALRQLTHDLASAGAPAWSPDGNAMVFASNRDRDYDIYTVHADGSALEKLTDLPDDEGVPAWSAR